MQGEGACCREFTLYSYTIFFGMDHFVYIQTPGFILDGLNQFYRS